MRERLKEIELHWVLVWLACVACLFTLRHGNFLSIIFMLVVLVRIGFSRNKNVMVTSLIIILIVIGHAFWLQFQIDQLVGLDLNQFEDQLILHLNPGKLEMRQDGLRGIVPVSYLKEGVKLTFEIDFSYPIDQADSELVDLMLNRVLDLKGYGKFQSLNPSRNFGVFDYREYLANQGVVWQFELDSVVDVRINEGLMAFVENSRNHVVNYLTGDKSSSWQNLYNKLFLNVNSDDFRDVRNYFSDFGLGHFIAISGFHIYYLSHSLNYSLLRMGITIEWSRRINFLVLVLYICLIKWPMGAARVILIQILNYLKNKYNLPLSGLDTLSIVGLLFLVLNPLFIHSLSYLLSFFISAVLILYRSNKRPKSKILNNINISFLCILFSWPIIIASSNEWNVFQLLFVLIFTVLFKEIIMPLILFSFIAIAFSLEIGNDIFSALDTVLDSIYALLEEGAINPVILNIKTLSQWILLILILAALYYLYKIHHQPLKAYLFPSFIYFSVFLILPYLDPTSRISFIDVGQGDAMLLQLSHNRGDWLIDTGGKRDWEDNSADPSFAEYTIIPALKALGVNRLEGVIISHADIDHMGNLLAIQKNFHISKIYLNAYALESQLWLAIRDEFSSQQLEVLQQGKHYYHEDIGIRILSAPESFLSYSNSVDNDSSLVSVIELGQLKLLSLGDISQEIEDKVLLDYFQEGDISLLKLAHHGSRTSSSEKFLEKLKPQLAIISAGYNNSYGHPHPEVLESLAKLNIAYLSTHEKGAIQISYHPIWGYDIITKFH